jgi:hypothetical protein
VKLLLLVVPREARDDAEAALQEVAGGARGFTEVPGVYGEGRSGPRFASRTAPGVSDLVFAVLGEDDLPAVKAALSPVEARLGRRLRAFVLPVEEAWS